MIQANDLRIGNYFYYKIPKTNDFEVTQIDWEAIELADLMIEDFNEKFKPIELTDKIMDTGWIEVVKGRVYLVLHLGDIRIIQTMEGSEIIINNKLNHIQYLHQLQNLYYSLTGKELEINCL